MRINSREKESKLPLNLAKKLFSYDRCDGHLYWRIRTSNRVKVGQLAGSTKSSNGYRTINVSGCLYLAHRIVWLLYYGSWPSGTIDHKDGNALNNKITNLREVPQRDNTKNAARSINNTSGFTGVSWSPRGQKWTSYAYLGPVKKSLGNYVTNIAACCARHQGNLTFNFYKNHGRN